jgi:hypothetical protein
MSFKSNAIVTFAALTLSAGAASAATYNFGGSGENIGESADFNAVGGPTVTVTAGATGVLNGPPVLWQTAGGLGVFGPPDTDPTRIDGSPIRSSETVTLTFGWAVRLLSFDLTGTDGNDQYDISINGGNFTNGIDALASNLVDEIVTTLTIRASGSFFTDGLVFGNDEFRLASVTTTPVPLPAGAGLLALGLAGLGLAARRRKA